MRHEPALAAGTPPRQRRSERHFGLDWLRIAAFALLIVHHVGMVFSPWSWVIKTPHTYAVLVPPMALLTPWRLSLLFAVSGYASAKLFARSSGPGDFAWSRAKRLLIPLAFGMAVLLPPEMWVRVQEQGYTQSYLHFWAMDYWRTGMFWGREFPSVEHLWFVEYLAAYSLLLAAVLAWQGARVMAGLAGIAACLAKDSRVLWMPILALIAVRLALLFVVAEEEGLLRDWSGHGQYLPVFVAGFVLGRTPALWPAVHRAAAPALLLAALCGAVAVAVDLHYSAAVPPHGVMALDRAARSAMGWSMIVVLFHLAERHWDRDHRWRKPLAEAVFPFYLVHQPAIVLIAWYSLPLHLHPLAEFALLLLGTLAACISIYLIGRRIGWVRPLIGLGPLVPRPRSVS